MKVYLDTSAVLKLAVEEAESLALADHLDSLPEGSECMSSWMLHTELHCAAHRRGIPAGTVTAVLGTITLVDADRPLMIRAAASRWGLRAADAIHVATALALECDAVITYDREMLDLLTSIGVRTLSPGC